VKVETFRRLSRDEVRKAIRFQKPMRTPFWYLGFPQETLNKYGRALRRLLAQYPGDFICAGAALRPREVETSSSDKQGEALAVVPGSLKKWESSSKQIPRRVVDEWGAVAEHRQEGVGFHPMVPAIANWAELSDYLRARVPRLNCRGRFLYARRVSKMRRDEYLLAGCPISFFEKMQTLLGIQQFYQGLLEHTEEVIRLGNALLHFGLGAVEVFGNLRFDGMLVADDFGSQRGLLVSPSLWREVFRPWYKALFEKIHSWGMDVVFHSCGEISAIVDELLEVGVDVLHPLQPGCINHEEFARKYRGRVCAYTGVDVQKLLITGTPDEIAEEVRYIKRLFTGESGGGLILGPTNAITPDTPLQNIEAFIRSSYEF
jgi:uroporphyrinogen decarboxylase